MSVNSRAAENKGNKILAFDNYIGVHCHPMAKQKKPEKIQIRPTNEDFAIIQAGMRKHGLDMSQILRMALRRFAEAEDLKAR